MEDFLPRDEAHILTKDRELSNISNATGLSRSSVRSKVMLILLKSGPFDAQEEVV